MKIADVTDINPDVVYRHTYDFAFFASGFEERAQYVPRLLDKARIRSPHVLGFTEFREEQWRLANDAFFQEVWSLPELHAASDDLALVAHARDIGAESSARSILVDYSSMSRLWYSGLLNWARARTQDGELTVDFVYAKGSYAPEFSVGPVTRVSAVPGCEGSASADLRSVALMCLGFDGLAPLAAVDAMEPDVVHAFVASSEDNEQYVTRALAENRVLVEEHAKGQALHLPLDSVERSYVSLAEFASVYRNEADVALIPMGPKPHVLACLLLSIRFPEFACLRVSHREQPSPVGTSGDVVATRVVFVGGSSELRIS